MKTSELTMPFKFITRLSPLDLATLFLAFTAKAALKSESDPGSERSTKEVHMKLYFAVQTYVFHKYNARSLIYVAYFQAMQNTTSISNKKHMTQTPFVKVQ